VSTSRRFARELALQALYGIEVGHRSPADVIDETCTRLDDSEGRTFVRDLVLGTLEHAAESDATLAPLLSGWTIERLPTIDRGLMRMAIFELQHVPEIPAAVIINEAIELAKRFSTEDSPRYVNGVLDRAARVIRVDTAENGGA
jgi:N utilization substance protein B